MRRRLVVLGTRRIHQGEKLKAIPDFWEIKGFGYIRVSLLGLAQATVCQA